MLKRETRTDAELMVEIEKYMSDVNGTIEQYKEGLTTPKQAYQTIAATLCHSLVEIATQTKKIDGENIELYVDEILIQLKANKPQKKVRIANALAEALYCLTISK